MAPRLIIATDTAFSSNRLAWTHQIHKLDLGVELKVGIVPAIANAVFAAPSKRLRKMPVNTNLLKQA
jgi:hypothetical protein